MFTVKFIGGAKKSFPKEQLKIEKSAITIEELVTLLVKLKPKDTPKLDTDNVLIAINGADSSAMNGRQTLIKENDLVSIIPIIHGGATKKIIFEFSNKQIQAQEIKGQNPIDVKFIDSLRKKYPRLLLQAVSSKFILDKYHLKKIVMLSLESEKKQTLLSKKIETDILMRFALTAQISNAIRNAGIKPKTNFILIAIGNKKSLQSLYLDLLPVSTNPFIKNNESALKKHFKITKKYLDSTKSKNPLADILVEKAAVLL